jgi:hypothetical protein
LKERIREVLKQASREKLQRAEEEEYWLAICRITNPARLENFMLRWKLLSENIALQLYYPDNQKSEILSYFRAEA